MIQSDALLAIRRGRIGIHVVSQLRPGFVYEALGIEARGSVERIAVRHFDGSPAMPLELHEAQALERTYS